MGAHIRTGLILLMLGFVMLRVGYSYIYSYQFQKLVQRELDGAGQHPGVRRLRASILDQGRALGLEIAPGDVLVERFGRGYQVRVSYAVPLDLHLYRTALRFNFVARRIGPGYGETR